MARGRDAAPDDRACARQSRRKTRLAQNLLIADKVDEALKIYTEIAAEDQKDANSLLRISQIYRQKRDFDKAREAGRKALAVDPNNLEVRYNEVSLLEREGKTAEAISALKNILTSSAKRSYSAGERGNRIVLLERLGLMYRTNEQYTEAIDTFRQIAEVDSNLGGRAAAQIADTYRCRRTHQGSRRSERRCEEVSGRSRSASCARVAACRNGQDGRSGRRFKTMLDGKNDRETYVTLAQIYEKGKDFTFRWRRRSTRRPSCRNRTTTKSRSRLCAAQCTKK